MSRLLAALAALALGTSAAPAFASSITLGGGWVADQISAADPTPSQNSAYTFTLTGFGMFRVTDAYVAGDTFYVRDGSSNLILTTTIGSPPSNPSGFGDNSTADTAWSSSSYGHGEVLLFPGSYSLTVTGDGAGGVPAGFFVRLDAAAPEPSTLALLGLGGAGLAAWSVRRRAKARPKA